MINQPPIQLQAGDVLLFRRKQSVSAIPRLIAWIQGNEHVQERDDGSHRRIRSEKNGPRSLQGAWIAKGILRSSWGLGGVRV